MKLKMKNKDKLFNDHEQSTMAKWNPKDKQNLKLVYNQVKENHVNDAINEVDCKFDVAILKCLEVCQ